MGKFFCTVICLIKVIHHSWLIVQKEVYNQDILYMLYIYVLSYSVFILVTWVLYVQYLWSLYTNMKIKGALRSLIGRGDAY